MEVASQNRRKANQIQKKEMGEGWLRLENKMSNLLIDPKTKKSLQKHCRMTNTGSLDSTN